MYLILKISENKKIYFFTKIDENETLYNLALKILKNINFSFTESFGFFSEIKNYKKSEKTAELFYDDFPEKSPLSSSGTKNIKIKDFFENKTEILFLFDYSKKYKYKIELIEKVEKNSKKKVPEKKGIFKDQFPEDEFEFIIEF